MKKILCVIRVSTTNQETISQHNDMISFLNSKGYSEESIEWLEVAGASARKANKKYLQMLETIKATIENDKDITACAFWCLDRLGRIESYINLMKEWFTNNHIQVYVKQPSLTLLKEDGTIDAGANIAWSVFAAMVAYQTEELMDKLKRGADQKRKEGKYIGGWLPLGFTVDKEGYIVVDSEKMSLVKMIFEEYASGKWSVIKLSREFNKRGIKATQSGLNKLLRNEKYKPFVGDLFDKVDKVLRNHDSAGIRTKETKYVHLATKILKCPYCGHGFMAYGDRNYKCYSQHNNMKNEKKIDCPSPSVSVDIIDTILYDLAMKGYRWQLENSDQSDIEELNKRKNICNQKINQCNNDLIKIDERIERAIELYTDGTINKSKYEQLKGKATSDKALFESEIELLNKEIEQIDNSIEVASNNHNLSEYLKLCATSYSDLPKMQIRELIHKYIKVAYVDKTEYCGRTSTLILVIDSKDRQHKFIYDYKNGRSNKWTVKLRQIYSDGSDLPYLDDPKYTSRTAQLKDKYIRLYESRPANADYIPVK